MGSQRLPRLPALDVVQVRSAVGADQTPFDYTSLWWPRLGPAAYSCPEQLSASWSCETAPSQPRAYCVWRCFLPPEDQQDVKGLNKKEEGP